MHLTINKK